MKIFNTTTFFATLAIFSMFFGAGNVVFPLVLGQMAGNQISVALVGLLITAIGGPLLGLFGAILYQGNCKRFFCEIGKYPGYLLLTICFILLGPFAVMPRCMIVSFAAIKDYFPNLNFQSYSIITTVCMFLLIIRRNNLLPLLGYILSPLLLGSLILIILNGFYSDALLEPLQRSSSQVFLQGLSIGYDTMDLIAAIFFSSTIWSLLNHKLETSNTEKENDKSLLSTCLISSVLSAILLSVIYVGLSYVAAKHTSLLSDSAPEELLIKISNFLLGPTHSIVANIAVSLACITTIMSLAVTMSDIAHQSFFAKKIDYFWIILSIMLITLALSNLGFKTIMGFIHPMVSFCYPTIIALTICNIINYFIAFRHTKNVVLLTFLGTALFMVTTG